MKSNKKLLLSLVTMLLFGVLLAAPVSAAEKTVATIESKEYTSLEAAIQKVKEGQTIVLQESVTYSKSLTINTSKKFNLNLNNKTLTFKKGASLVVKKGSVTISNAKITQKDAKGIILKVSTGATLNIESGTYKGHISNAGTMTITKGTFQSLDKKMDDEDVMIKNTGTMTISGGTFKGGKANLLGNWKKITINGGTFTNALTVQNDNPQDSGWLIANVNKNSNLTISGGSFTAATVGIVNTPGATVKITKGNSKFISKLGGVFLNFGTAEIEGGTFATKEDWAIAYNQDGGKTAKITVTGGTFTTEWTIFENYGERTLIEVKGGTFKSTVAGGEQGGARNDIAMLMAFSGKMKLTGGTFQAKHLGLYWENDEANGTVTVGKSVKVNTKGLEVELTE